MSEARTAGREWWGTPTAARAIQLSLAAIVVLMAAPLAAQRGTAKNPASTPAAPARPAPQHELAVPFAPGETLTYDVSWSSTLTAGTATVRVAEKKPSFNSTAYYIVAEGRPSALVAKLYTLYYKVDTLLDVYSLLPQRGSVYSEEGKRHRMKSTVFDRARKTAEYQVVTTTTVKKTMPTSAVAQDPLGALYVLRSIPLKPGEKITMPICDNGANYKLLVEAGGLEPIKTGAGVMQAQKLTMTPQGADVGARALTLWLSSDAAHLPVKMSAQLPVGAFVLTLSARQ